MCRQHMHLINEVDFIATLAWRIRHIIKQLARVFNFGARSGINLNQINKTPLINRHAIITHAAWGTGNTRITVQTLRQDTSDGRFTDAARTRKQIGMMQTIIINRINQCL